ncbi:unnamed protein product, partial [Scytosiphon promiscuus]
EEFTSGPEAARAAIAARRATGEGILSRGGGGGGGGGDGESSSSSSWADFGTRESRHKENRNKPSRWTDGALGETPGLPPPRATAVAPPSVNSRRGARAPAAVPFPVYVDEHFAEKAEEDAAAQHRLAEKQAGGGGGGLSVRQQLDPRASGSAAAAPERRKELLAKDPLFFVNNQKAAKAHEKRVAKSNEALLGSAEGGLRQKEEDQEEQVEEARARYVAEQQQQQEAGGDDEESGAEDMEICPSDSEDGDAVNDEGARGIGQSAAGTAAEVDVRGGGVGSGAGSS